MRSRPSASLRAGRDDRASLARRLRPPRARRSPSSTKTGSQPQRPVPHPERQLDAGDARGVVQGAARRHLDLPSLGPDRDARRAQPAGGGAAVGDLDGGLAGEHGRGAAAGLAPLRCSTCSGEAFASRRGDRRATTVHSQRAMSTPMTSRASHTRRSGRLPAGQRARVPPAHARLRRTSRRSRATRRRRAPTRRPGPMRVIASSAKSRPTPTSIAAARRGAKVARSARTAGDEEKKT